MSEPKPIASLSGVLLARKGLARPAMRRPSMLGTNGNAALAQDDLGWNDMGYDVDPHHAAPEAPRALGHGLSPMAQSAQEAQDHGDAMDAFTAAVERAMIDPAPVGPASIAPIIADAPLPTPAEPPLVVRQRERIEAAVEDMRVAIAPAVSVPSHSTAVKAHMPGPRAHAGTRGSYAFTLRLDPDRHLRLRLASATSNRSSQQILIALVDEFLSTIPEIEAFAARLPASAAR